MCARVLDISHRSMSDAAVAVAAADYVSNLAAWLSLFMHVAKLITFALARMQQQHLNSSAVVATRCRATIYAR